MKLIRVVGSGKERPAVPGPQNEILYIPDSIGDIDSRFWRHGRLSPLCEML